MKWGQTGGSSKRQWGSRHENEGDKDRKRDRDRDRDRDRQRERQRDMKLRRRKSDEARSRAQHHEMVSHESSNNNITSGSKSRSSKSANITLRNKTTTSESEGAMQPRVDTIVNSTEQMGRKKEAKEESDTDKRQETNEQEMSSMLRAHSQTIERTPISLLPSSSATVHEVRQGQQEQHEERAVEEEIELDFGDNDEVDDDDDDDDNNKEQEEENEQYEMDEGILQNDGDVVMSEHSEQTSEGSANKPDMHNNIVQLSMVKRKPGGGRASSSWNPRLRRPRGAVELKATVMQSSTSSSSSTIPTQEVTKKAPAPAAAAAAAVVRKKKRVSRSSGCKWTERDHELLALRYWNLRRLDAHCSDKEILTKVKEHFSDRSVAAIVTRWKMIAHE